MRKNGWKVFISSVYLLVSVCLLFGVCVHCYPQVEDKLRQVIVGMEHTPVKEAFGVLADGLGDSRPIKEVLSESYEVLKGEAS